MLRIPLPEYAGFALRIYAKISTGKHEGNTNFCGHSSAKVQVVAWDKVIFVDLCPRKYVNPCVNCGLTPCQCKRKVGIAGPLGHASAMSDLCKTAELAKIRWQSFLAVQGDLCRIHAWRE